MHILMGWCLDVYEKIDRDSWDNCVNLARVPCYRSSIAVVLKFASKLACAMSPIGQMLL